MSLVYPLAWPVRALLQHHARIFFGRASAVLLPPLLEPLIYLVAFGFVVDRSMSGFRSQGQGYLAYLLPGLVCSSTFSIALNESLYGTLSRISAKRSYLAILSAPLGVTHVVWAEIHWACLRGLLHGTVVLALASGFHCVGLVHYHPAALWAVGPALLMGSLTFAALGVALTSRLPSLRAVSLPLTLVVHPLSLLSATFFPLPSRLEPWMQMNPLFLLSTFVRSAAMGGPLQWERLGLLGLEMTLALMLAHAFLSRRLRTEWGGGTSARSPEASEAPSRGRSEGL